MSPRHQRRAVLSAGLAALLLLAGPTRADVIIVDPQGGPGADLLHDAIVDAQDGDVILLRPGDYWEGGGPNIPIDAKGLTLMPEEGVGQQFIRGLRVRDVPASSTVFVRNLFIGQPNSQIGATERLSLSNCAGGTWFEDCTINGRDGKLEAFFPLAGGPGVIVTNCGSVMFRGCTVRGGAGYDHDGLTGSTSGGPAALIRTSRVAFYNCRFDGGDGGAGPGIGATDGGCGIDVNDELTPNDRADVFISGCFMNGGTEGPASFGTSGDGLRINGVDSSAVIQDSNASPGGVLGEGSVGSPVNVILGEVSGMAGEATGFEAESPVTVGTEARLAFDGLPGELVAINAAFAADWLLVPAQLGASVLAPGSQAGPFVLGTLDGNGELLVDIVVPPLGGGASIAVLLQAVFSDGVQTQLGPASQMTWLQ